MTFSLASSLNFRFLSTFGFFYLDINQKVFFTNNLAFLVFFYQSTKELEVFYL